MSAAMFVTQGPVLGRASGKLAQSAVFALGLVSLIAAFLVFPGGTSGAAFAGGLLFAFGNGLAWPTFLLVLLTARRLFRSA